MLDDKIQILSKVCEVFEATFKVNPKLVTMETLASDIPEWDSVGQLSLASDLEETFNITLEVDDMMEMESVGEIVRIIQGKLAAKT